MKINSSNQSEKKIQLEIQIEYSKKIEFIEIYNGIDLINDKIALIISDLNQIKNDPSIVKKGKLITSNAKDLKKIKLLAKYDGVITSPPYLNGTNYIRNTKLDLWCFN